jgi:hypothetical protein
MQAKPLPASFPPAARQRENRPDRAPRRHHGEPLARGGGAAESGGGARRILSGHQHQCARSDCPAIDVGKLLEYGSRVPQAGAALHLPIFDAGGSRRAIAARRRRCDAAVAAYQDRRWSMPRAMWRRRRDARADRGAARAALDRGRCGAGSCVKRRGARAPGHRRCAPN